MTNVNQTTQSSKKVLGKQREPSGDLICRLPTPKQTLRHLWVRVALNGLTSSLTLSSLPEAPPWTIKIPLPFQESSLSEKRHENVLAPPLPLVNSVLILSKRTVRDLHTNAIAAAAWATAALALS